MPASAPPVVSGPAPVSVNAPVSDAPRHVGSSVAVPQTLLFDVQQQWSEVVQSAIRDGHPLLATALTFCRPLSLAKGILTLEAPSDLCDQSADDAVILTTLARIIGHVSGHQVPVRLRSAAGDHNSRSARYQAAEAHPLIQAIRKRFAADIIAREPISHEDWLQRLTSAERPSLPTMENDPRE